ncbi:MAG TPA: DUF1109 domain-containing protein [Rhizomicrobium sp.]|nr:DUF1109 domain-containing protein [Rhizomicrobium sp.]
MNSDLLISRLADDLKPMSRHRAAMRLALGVVAGAAVALLGAISVAGMPFSAIAITGIAPFAMKLAFTFALTCVGAVVLFGVGRPGHDSGWGMAWLLAPFGVAGLAALLEVVQRTSADLLGSSWSMCLIAISLMSLPVFTGVVWAFRSLAPTRLRLAGFLAGLLSGATAALLYALYCQETTASFLVTWYSLGILLVAAAGALIGPQLLRW